MPARQPDRVGACRFLRAAPNLPNYSSKFGSGATDWREDPDVRPAEDDSTMFEFGRSLSQLAGRAAGSTSRAETPR